MNEIVDLDAIQSDYFKVQRDRRQHYRDVLREALRHKVEWMQDDAEQALDYAKNLMQANGDVTDELAAMEEAARSMLLMIGILRMKRGV